MPTLTYATHRMTMRWLRGVATTPPASLTVGLLTTAPNPDGTGVVEPSALGGYTRRPFTLGNETVTNGVTSAVNTNAILFPTATAVWTPVTHLGIFSVEGELLVYGPLAASRSVQIGDAIAFGEGAVQLRLR